MPVSGNILKKAPLKDGSTAVEKASSKSQPAVISDPVRKGILTKFIDDESGGGKLPFPGKQAQKDWEIATQVAKTLVDQNPKQVFNGMASQAIQKQKFQLGSKQERLLLKDVPEMTAPVGFPTEAELFFKKSQQAGNLIYQPIGKDVLYYLRSYRQLKHGSNEKLIRQTLSHAERHNYERIFIGWDPTVQSTVVEISNQNYIIIGVGKMSRGEGINPFLVVEVTASRQPAVISDPVGKGILRKFIEDESGGGKLPQRLDNYQSKIEEVITARNLTNKDVGIPAEWEHRAIMTLYKDRVAVKLDWVKAPKGEFSLNNYVSHLLDLPRANNVKILEFEALFTNPKFCEKWKTQYGEYLVRNYHIRSGARKIEFCKFEFPVSMKSPGITTISTKSQPAAISYPVRRDTLRKFNKDESGGGKLSLEREYWIEKFKKLGYQKFPNEGKGSHEKLKHDFCRTVTMILDKELAPGTARQYKRQYEEAKRIINASPVALEQSTLSKFIERPSHNNPLPHRIDYSEDYFKAKNEFTKLKEFNGTLTKDLLVVQYHSSEPLHEFRTHKWFMPICEGNKHSTIDGIQDAVAKLSAYGEITEVTLARIPAGEPVRFLHGRAKEKINSLNNEIRPGDGVQYRFFDFDTKWIVESKKLPL